MGNKKPFIVLISGPVRSGKTTVAKRLADMIEYSVLIQKDLIRSVIKNGFVKPPGFDDKEEFIKQQRLSIKNAVCLAKNSYKYGFNVVIDDMIHYQDNLDLYENGLHPINIHYKFLLFPSKTALIERYKKRPNYKRVGGVDNIVSTYNLIDKIDKQSWIVLDNTNWSANMTVKKVIEYLEND